MNNASRFRHFGQSSGWFALVILVGTMWQMLPQAGLPGEAQGATVMLPHPSTLRTVTVPLSLAMLPESVEAPFLHVEWVLKGPGGAYEKGPARLAAAAGSLRPVPARILLRSASVPFPYYDFLHVYRC
jgi:hypothetical protein